jgi:hypothetical protein
VQENNIPYPWAMDLELEEVLQEKLEEMSPCPFFNSLPHR